MEGLASIVLPHGYDYILRHTLLAARCLNCCPGNVIPDFNGQIYAKRIRKAADASIMPQSGGWIDSLGKI